MDKSMQKVEMYFDFCYHFNQRRGQNEVCILWKRNERY